MIDSSYLRQIHVFEGNNARPREKESIDIKEDEDGNVDVVCEEGTHSPTTWKEDAVS
jgi:hypothetical protein